MAVMKFTKNMGKTDRIVRGILGSIMLVNGIMSNRKAEAGVGGAFAVYGLTGFDPLLKLFGVSTISGAEDNIIHQLKQTAPGKGINPILTQQAVPKTEHRSINAQQTLADSLSIK